LRGAASTAPYFHDGSAPNLAAVVAHYSDINLERLHADGESLLRPLGLDARARADLLAFLETLSQPSPIQPARAPGAGRKELIHSQACTIARSAPSSTPP
jgi:cytochrome c peroxidase